MCSTLTFSGTTLTFSGTALTFSGTTLTFSGTALTFSGTFNLSTPTSILLIKNKIFTQVSKN
jgi:hypothetical protein